MTNVKNNETSNKAVRAGMWYIVSNFLLRGISILTTPLFTRILSKGEYGNFNNFTSWMSLLTILTTLDLYTSINRARFDFDDDIDAYISSIAILGTMFTAVCYLIVLIFKNFFMNLFSMQFIYINVMFITLLISPVLTLLQIKNRLYQKYKLVVFISITSSIGSVILSILLVIILKDKLFGRIIGYILPLFVVDIFIYMYILYKGKKISLNYWKYALVTSVPLIPHALGSNILGTSDRLMIQKFCGASDLALYSLTYNCALIVNILWTSMNQAWSPWLMENLNQKNYNNIKKRSKPYLLLFLALAIIIILLAPEIVYVLGSKTYLQAKYVMPPVIMGCVFQFAYSMYVNIEIYERKTWMISLGTMLAAGMNVLLNFIFIPKFGYVAAAYTTLVGYAFLLLFHYLSVKTLELNISYDNKFIFIALTLEVLLMVFITCLYNYNIIRYVITGIYSITLLAIALKYKKIVISFFRNK